MSNKIILIYAHSVILLEFYVYCWGKCVLQASKTRPEQILYICMGICCTIDFNALKRIFEPYIKTARILYYWLTAYEPEYFSHIFYLTFKEIRGEVLHPISNISSSWIDSRYLLVIAILVCPKILDTVYTSQPFFNCFCA